MQLYHFTIYLQKMLKEVNQVHTTKKTACYKDLDQKFGQLELKATRKISKEYGMSESG